MYPASTVRHVTILGLTIDCQSFLLAQACSQYPTCVLLYYGSSVTAAHQVKEFKLKYEQYVETEERPTYQWYTKSVNKCFRVKTCTHQLPSTSTSGCVGTWSLKGCSFPTAWSQVQHSPAAGGVITRYKISVFIDLACDSAYTLTWAEHNRGVGRSKLMLFKGLMLGPSECTVVHCCIVILLFNAIKQLSDGTTAMVWT